MTVDHGLQESLRTGQHPRSPEWPHVETEHRAKQPNCVCCGKGPSDGVGVQVHHIFPFHYCIALGRPDLELDDRNLITLCQDEEGKPAENHHLLIGHLDSWQSSNLDVSTDATETFHGTTAAAIKNDPRWKAKVAARLKPLDEMTGAEKADFTAKMNARFPKRG